MADQWFYARGGQQAGPVSFEQLSQLARTGGLTANDLVWQEGTPDWQPAGQVPGLFAAATGGYPPAPAPSPYAAPPGPYAAAAAPHGVPYAQANYYGAPAGQSFAKDAQSAMIIAIIGIFCLGIILGPIAIVQGNKARKNMRASGNMEGEGMAVAAIVIGWIMVGLFGMWLLFMIIAIAAGGLQ